MEANPEFAPMKAPLVLFLLAQIVSCTDIDRPVEIGNMVVRIKEKPVTRSKICLQGKRDFAECKFYSTAGIYAKLSRYGTSIAVISSSQGATDTDTSAGKPVQSASTPVFDGALVEKIGI